MDLPSAPAVAHVLSDGNWQELVRSILVPGADPLRKFTRQEAKRQDALSLTEGCIIEVQWEVSGRLEWFRGTVVTVLGQGKYEVHYKDLSAKKGWVVEKFNALTGGEEWRLVARPQGDGVRPEKE